MRLAVLGPLTVSDDDGRRVPVTPRKARELLVLLALEHPRALSLEALAARLWDDPPPAAGKTIQAHLSRLRRALTSAGAAPPGIAGGPVGYHLSDLSDGGLDIEELHRLSRTGRQAMLTGTWPIAASSLGRARELFRGSAELPETLAGHAVRAWLDEVRDGVVEDHVEAVVAAGQLDAAIADLELLTAAHPLRERLWALRMIALARAGRTAEALRAFADARQVLVEEAGLEPGDDLRRLEREILDGRMPSISATSPGRPRPATAPAPTVDQSVAAAVRYVEVDDVHVAYCSVGDASRDLVMMNAGTIPVDSVLTEPRLARAVEQLSAFARVTWFDRRGLGLSDRSTADRLPTVQDWVRDLVSVLDAIGATSPVIYACEDTTPIALELAVQQPDRLAGIVLTNASPRFTRGDGYEHGVDPLLAEQGAAETTSATPVEGGFDLLTLIAPTVAGDDAFRAWWDTAGRRGATPQVARALRSRYQNSDLRPLVDQVRVPVLHLVNPTAAAHDPGHDRYLAEHLADVETHELPGPDELWWLDTSGLFATHVERFTRQRTEAHRQRTPS